MTPETSIPAAETPAANGHGESHSTASFKALMLGSIASFTATSAPVPFTPFARR